GDVSVSFTASDALSGLAFTTPETLVSSEGAKQDIVGTAKDKADNSATASVIVNIDKTAPQITAASKTAPNANGWYGGDVVVSFAASDALSGLAFSSPDVVVSTEGAAQEISGTATDKADHTANASVIVNIDKTAPVIALSSRTPANAAGWNNTDVSLTWQCTDSLSGPVVNQVAQSLSAEGAAQNAIGTCADLAGHTASNTQSGINIDKTSPTSQITTPANGAVYVLNGIVNAAYGCADALSGVSACVGPVAPGAAVDTATVGDKTFTVNAADAAGNQSAASHSYTVQYAFSGFSNPIVAMPAVNTANAGKTVPVKYSLRDVNNAVISDLTSFVSLISAPVACDTNVPTAAAEETDGAGSTTIHFDSGQFIYNWKTQAAWEGTCRVLQLELKDGTRHLVAFQFK
ncbi:MAG TPA: PxKF domain-containing protein, partial [Vicinamibacterales bacterium]